MFQDVLNSQLLPFEAGISRQWIRRKLMVFALGFALLSGVGLWAALSYLHAQASDQGQRMVETFARIIEEQTTLTVQTVDQRLQLAADEVKHRLEHGALGEESGRELLRGHIKDLPSVRAMWVVDAKGDLIYTSEYGGGGVNFSDRSHFQNYMKYPNARFVLDGPVRGRTNGAWLINALRPLDFKVGNFSGAIVAAIDPTYLDELWRTVDLGVGSSISLFSSAGILMTRSPFDDALMGKNLADLELFPQGLPATAAGAFQNISVVDGKRRSYAFRTLSTQPPMVVLVGQAYDEQLAAWRKLAVLGAAIWLAASAAIAMMCIFLDRMWQQRAQAETNLESSEQRLRLALHGADLGLWDWNGHTGALVVNRRWRAMIGLAPNGPQETLEMWMARVHPDDRPALDKLLSELLRSDSKVDFEVELRVLHSDGRYIWILDKGSVVERSAAGRVRRMVGTHLDITQTKHTEEYLRETNAQNKALLNAIPDLIFTNRRDGLYLSYHATELSTFPVAPEMFLQKNVRDAFPVQIAEQFLAAFQQALDSNSVQELTYVWTVDGHEMAFEARVVPSTHDTLITIVRDVTQRKRGMVKTRLSDHALKAISQGVIITQSDSCIVSTNEAFERITGYGESEVIGMNCRFLQGDLTDPQAVDGIRMALSQGESYSGEILNYRKDGSAFWNELTISPMRDEHGALTHFIGVTRDITARREAEGRERESTRHLKLLSKRVLEAQETERRRVAIELHDELGQSLTAIKINLQSSERFKGQSVHELNVENVRIVEDAIQQVRRLALALRPSMLDDLGLVPALHWIAEQTAVRSGFSIHFHPALATTRLAPEIETACFRVVQEALTNIARHARARRVDIDLYDEDDDLVLAIKDDGCGFPVASMRERAAKGASMGLPGMHERATLLGGRLSIDSTVGVGTTVRMVCPKMLREVLA